ncbi:hypothetical protein [Weissella sp. MSCH1]|uniref:hypothetical protein n=1 Tax=Weissella sp. MSCH1 TaxID=3383343 RepID=UPI003896C06A
MAKNNAVEKLVKLGEYEAEPLVQGLGWSLFGNDQMAALRKLPMFNELIADETPTVQQLNEQKEAGIFGAREKAIRQVVGDVPVNVLDRLVRIEELVSREFELRNEYIVARDDYEDDEDVQEILDKLASVMKQRMELTI